MPIDRYFDIQMFKVRQSSVGETGAESRRMRAMVNAPRQGLLQMAMSLTSSMRVRSSIGEGSKP